MWYNCNRVSLSQRVCCASWSSCWFVFDEELDLSCQTEAWELLLLLSQPFRRSHVTQSPSLLWSFSPTLLTLGCLSVCMRSSSSPCFAVVDLVYWRSTKRTGVVFTGLVIALASLFQLSAITLLSHVFLGVMCVTVPLRLYYKLLELLRWNPGVHPFQWVQRLCWFRPPPSLKWWWIYLFRSFKCRVATLCPGRIWTMTALWRIRRRWCWWRRWCCSSPLLSRRSNAFCSSTAWLTPLRSHFDYKVMSVMTRLGTH